MSPLNTWEGDSEENEGEERENKHREGKEVDGKKGEGVRPMVGERTQSTDKGV